MMIIDAIVDNPNASMEEIVQALKAGPQKQSNEATTSTSQSPRATLIHRHVDGVQQPIVAAQARWPHPRKRAPGPGSIGQITTASSTISTTPDPVRSSINATEHGSAENDSGSADASGMEAMNAANTGSSNQASQVSHPSTSNDANSIKSMNENKTQGSPSQQQPLPSSPPPNGTNVPVPAPPPSGHPLPAPAPPPPRQENVCDQRKSDYD